MSSLKQCCGAVAELLPQKICHQICPAPGRAACPAVAFLPRCGAERTNLLSAKLQSLLLRHNRLSLTVFQLKASKHSSYRETVRLFTFKKYWYHFINRGMLAPNLCLSGLYFVCFRVKNDLLKHFGPKIKIGVPTIPLKFKIWNMRQNIGILPIFENAIIWLRSLK